MCNEFLEGFAIEETLEFTPEFIRANAELFPPIFQASLLSEVDVHLDKVPDLFLSLLEALLPFDTALLYMWEPGPDWYCRGIRREIPPRITEGNVFTSYVREQGRPLFIEDVPAAGIDEELLPVSCTSMIALPIYLDTAVVGCVECYRDEGAPFTLNDVNIVKHLLLYSERVWRDTYGREQAVDDVLNVRADIPQRHVMIDIVHQYTEQARRLGYPVSVALVNVDDESIFGFFHEGLRSWVSLGKGLRDGLRCYDKVLRYDETSFILMLPGCGRGNAVGAVNNALQGLGPELAESMRVGIATFPDEAQDAKSLLGAVQQALSYARRQGLAVVNYSQTDVLRPGNVSLELVMRQAMRSGPSMACIDTLLKVLKLQCGAKTVDLRPEGPGRRVSWDTRDLGFLVHEGLDAGLAEWVMSYLAPAWAVAAGHDPDLENWYGGMLLSTSLLADLRAGCQTGYSLRVADGLYTLCRSLQFDEETALRWATTALAANIGYLGIPSSLFAREVMTPFDRSRVSHHPLISARILEETTLIDYDADILVHHHENLDGGGYPRGLKGQEIPLGARALRVVDTYQALTSPRIHRDSRTPEEAVAMMGGLEGAVLDPEVSEVYRGIIGF